MGYHFTLVFLERCENGLNGCFPACNTVLLLLEEEGYVDIGSAVVVGCGWTKLWLQYVAGIACVECDIYAETRS